MYEKEEDDDDYSAQVLDVKTKLNCLGQDWPMPLLKALIRRPEFLPLLILSSVMRLQAPPIPSESLRDMKKQKQ